MIPSSSGATTRVRRWQQTRRQASQQGRRPRRGFTTWTPRTLSLGRRAPLSIRPTACEHSSELLAKASLPSMSDTPAHTGAPGAAPAPGHRPCRDAATIEAAPPRRRSAAVEYRFARIPVPLRMYCQMRSRPRQNETARIFRLDDPSLTKKSKLMSRRQYSSPTSTIAPALFSVSGQVSVSTLITCHIRLETRPAPARVEEMELAQSKIMEAETQRRRDVGFGMLCGSSIVQATEERWHQRLRDGGSMIRGRRRTITYGRSGIGVGACDQAGNWRAVS